MSSQFQHAPVFDRLPVPSSYSLAFQNAMIVSEFKFEVLFLFSFLWFLPFHTRVLVTVLKITFPLFPGSTIIQVRLCSTRFFFEFLRRIWISEFRIVICTIFFQSQFFLESKLHDQFRLNCNFNTFFDCLSFATLPHQPHTWASISRRKRCTCASVTLNITKFSDAIRVVISFCYRALHRCSDTGAHIGRVSLLQKVFEYIIWYSAAFLAK